MTFIEILFWTSLGLTAYSYVVYPIIVCGLARLFGRIPGPIVDANGQREWPQVSLVIAAYKEEDVILERLQNALLIDYPIDRFEIVIGCDGDEDLTGELVRTVEDPRVRLMQFPVRRGKASVLNDCIPEATGEIVVLSDANTMMDRDALKRLVRHFGDPQVGGVVGKLILQDAETGQNVDGIYWSYENQIKRAEGQLGALLGANGAIYAIRKELYDSIPANTIIDDFLIGMRVHLAGRKLIYDETAMAREETAPAIQDEFHRRSRIGAGAFQSLCWLVGLLNPLRGRVAFAFVSHKVLRWFTPAFLIAAIVSNVLLIGNPFYLKILLIHELFYVAAFGGLWFTKGGKLSKLLRVPAMFVSMNVALGVGFWRFASGIKGGTWKRTERSTTEAATENAKVTP